MKVKDIKDLAKQMDIKAGKMRKDELIRAIQKAEGNFDCFGTALAGECTQLNCLWRADCIT